MFGVSLDQQSEQAIIPPIDLTLCPGEVVFITGVSGGGKSTVLRLIEQAIRSEHASDQAARPGIIAVTSLPALPDAALVDALARPEGNDAAAPPSAALETVCRWLSLAGLNDAAVMLRRPCELSEGQRYRLHLAQAMAIAERMNEPWCVMLADEYGSTLDRATSM